MKFLLTVTRFSLGAASLTLAGLAPAAAHADDGAVFGYKLNIAIRGWITPTYDGSKHVGPTSHWDRMAGIPRACCALGLQRDSGAGV